MDNMETFDVIVIGGGPGGYVAAIRAGQLGLRCALVEKEALGGVCLNWGCIPTKALLRNAEVIHLLNQGETFGFRFENLEVDYGAAQRRSREIVARQAEGLDFLMRKNKIAVYAGTARLSNRTQVEIQPSGETLTARNIILATGARARILPGVAADGDKVITYREALALTEVPPSAIIIGAGPVGMEFATLWNRYGCRVTVVEMLPRVLPLEDEAISREAEAQFRQAGIEIKTGARVDALTASAEAVTVVVEEAGQRETMRADKVLAAIGFVPNSEDLGLEALGVETDRGQIVIDDRMRTTVPNVYAIGDVTGKLGLAHVASAQGLIAAEAIAGLEPPALDYARLPRCTYSAPEVASVGLTEAAASAAGYEVITATFPFRPNGKAQALGEPDGFVKLVAEAHYKEVLGVHLIGSHVTELIAGPAGMIGLETTAEELARTVHPHPTLSEVIMEAAQGVLGQGIHL
jgi:dihydrolipoamide dehydrogenase